MSLIIALHALSLVYCVFFFQAEDGIRDVAVTGVQTCALPISPRAWSSRGLPLQLVPALPEGAARHRGEIARPRPVAEEGKAPDRAVTDEGPLQDAGDAARQPVEEGARQEPPDRREHDPLDPGRDPLLVHLTPELDEHARDVDPHRACVDTRPAERGGVRQLLHRAGAVQHRRQQYPDGARVGVAVGVAADLAVDGADVEARAAAQTVERLAEWPGELIDPAVVEEDQMEFLRPLELPRAPRALDERRVDGELLAGRALREDRQEHPEGGHP